MGEAGRYDIRYAAQVRAEESGWGTEDEGDAAKELAAVRGEDVVCLCASWDALCYSMHDSYTSNYSSVLEHSVLQIRALGGSNKDSKVVLMRIQTHLKVVSLCG